MLTKGEAEERLILVSKQIEAASRRTSGLARPFELVAVSKNFGADAVRPFLEAGQRVFGENRVQEAQGKWPALRVEYPDVALHLIGPLQTNKAADAVRLFDVIESLDRDKLARVLSAEMAKAGRRPECFVQVNIGAEAQKAGIALADCVAFVNRCRDAYGLPVTGLMCIPPAGEAPGPYFAQLALLAREAGLDKLSMGMSGDFEIAVLMGATHVRIGTALFGDRTPINQEPGVTGN